MPGVRRFEDLTAWQRARSLTRDIYRVTAVAPLSREFGLKDQIRRASVSVMSNIAEGFACGNPRGFANSLRIALGSAAEVRCQLYIALDADLIAEEQFHRFTVDLDHVVRLLRGLLRSIHNRLPQRTKH